jgi:micrococcal nuclease
MNSVVNRFQKFPLITRVAVLALIWWIVPTILVWPHLTKTGKLVLSSGLVFVFLVVSIAASLGSTETLNSSEVQGLTNSANQQELANQKQAEATASLETERRLALENLITSAQMIDTEVTFDKEAGADNSQDIEQTPSIANPGNTNQDQKLFDVLSVVDGDTIKISELGTLRLIGIDTPETKDPRKIVQCYGIEASEFAVNMLSGQQVYLEFDPANRIDRYGRTLAYVYRSDGFFYNQQAVAQGYAHSYTKYPHPQLDLFNSAQREAQSKSLGLWAVSTCNGDTLKAPAVVAPKPNASKSSSSTKTVSKSSKSTPPSTPTPKPISGEFIAGSCKFLKDNYRIGNFVTGDPNYTTSRDRNGDGIACEM